ncbi:MAG TPA: geranylgeranyl reductase family protein [Thermodesulfobacteriota bacterium]|nr:geranylgeranyl reductase family protein [Thermodesulfobacteriota bacterium]
MYDLIVVGGGPSGSSAGRRAAQLGLHTLLIEKEYFPRYKACGGAVSEQAMSYLDFKIPEDIQEKNIYGARVHFKGQVLERHKDYRIATTINRSILDELLLRKAKEPGAVIIEGQKVTRFIEKNNHVEVYTKQNFFKAKYLIISEGAHGSLKYSVRPKDTKDEYGICVVAEIEEDSHTIDHYLFNAIDIHFGVANFGYGWIFPHKKHFSVGIGGIAKDLHKPKKVMAEFLKANGFDGNYALKVHLLPVGGIKRKLGKSRVLLSGDSGGFVDSFYGEGIAYAIRSGQLAADAVSLTLHNKIDLVKKYESLCNKEFLHNLKYSYYLSWLMHRFPNIFFKIFTQHEIAIDRYLEVPALKGTYKNYIKWILPRVPGFLLKSVYYLGK